MQSKRYDKDVTGVGTTVYLKNGNVRIVAATERIRPQLVETVDHCSAWHVRVPRGDDEHYYAERRQISNCNNYLPV